MPRLQKKQVACGRAGVPGWYGYHFFLPSFLYSPPRPPPPASLFFFSEEGESLPDFYLKTLSLICSNITYYLKCLKVLHIN